MSPVGRLLRGVTHATSLVIGGALLLAAARPIATDDLWWHAALGRSYAAHGPWLDADPLLYTAAAAPTPSAWLFDIAVFATGSAGGFHALRALHVSLVAAVLAAAGGLPGSLGAGPLAAGWGLRGRPSRSAVAASLLTATFAALAAYRLAQLRPHLLTILATFVLYTLVMEDRGEPSRRRVLAAIGLLALWANLHAAFVLGPALLAVALAGLLLALPLQPAATRRRDRRRAVALGCALGLGLLATLANPDGWSRYRDFAEIGAETPALSLVGDEWLPVALLRLPATDLPPSPLAWGLLWGLLLLVPLAVVRAVRAWRAESDPNPQTRSDPALVALALAGLAGPLFAVRLLWLPIFSLVFLARSARARLDSAAGAGWRGPLAFASASVLLAVGFFTVGDWPAIAGPFRFPRVDVLRAKLATPYEPGRYFGQEVWLLEDSGVEGNVFNEYYMGGFLGFWLAPRLRGSSNGTLNVTPDALEANRAIRARRGARPGEDFLALLDRQQVDVFLGIRLPTLELSRRPNHYTTAYLEGTPGWVLVFRSVRSAVYLRDRPRNRANFAALEAWYAREGVPFDARSGFDVERVIREAPDWAEAHGIVPRGFALLQAAAHGYDAVYRASARDRLASLYAALGLYGHAIRLDTSTLGQDPGAVLPRRRLVWALLRARRTGEALRVAEELPETSSADVLTREVFAAARHFASLAEPEAAALVAGLPLFWPAEAAPLEATLSPPRPRPWPRSTPATPGATPNGDAAGSSEGSGASG